MTVGQARPVDLLPGLPDDLAILCLARVPSLSVLCKVCSSWKAIVSRSDFFHSSRAFLGLRPQQWIYALLHHPPQDDALQPAFSWHAYNPISKFWHCLPPFPIPVEFHLSSPSVQGLRHAVQCANSATKLFMVAGSRCIRSENGTSNSKGFSLEPALHSPLIFDTQTREWVQGAPFRNARRWCVCGTAGGKLIVASGCGRDWDMALSKSVEMYDPEAGQWFKKQQLKTSAFSRSAVSAVNYKEKLHIVSSVGAILDPGTGNWENMPRGMREGWSGQGVVVDGRLFVLEETRGRLKVYDEGKDEWKYVAMEEELLKNMEQLAGGMPGMFLGIVREVPLNNGGASQSEAMLEPDVIRIVDVRNVKLAVMDLAVPSCGGQIVALHVLSRTFNMAGQHLPS